MKTYHLSYDIAKTKDSQEYLKIKEHIFKGIKKLNPKVIEMVSESSIYIEFENDNNGFIDLIKSFKSEYFYYFVSLVCHWKDANKVIKDSYSKNVNLKLNRDFKDFYDSV